MTIRAFGALLCGAVLVLATQTDLAQAQSASQATTVKSSKSNQSERMGGGKGAGSAAKATTVKSSKSNTSDRLGSTKGSSGPAKVLNLNSSRSN